MPIFRYSGLNEQGAEVSGTIEADSQKLAASEIRDQGIYPKDITQHSRGAKRYGRLSKRFLPAITRQLSTLFSAGVPLLEALRSLSEEHKGAGRFLLVELREKVSAGASLSRAMEDYAGLFPDFYVNMVASGEAGGTLDGILLNLADFLEKQNVAREKARSALIYPAFMSVVGLAVTVFLFTFAVPRMVTMFEDSEAALPLITIILIGVSNFLASYWWLLLTVFSGGLIFVRWLRKTQPAVLDLLLLKAPGGLLQTLYYMRFTRTLGFLLQGGLPILRALELSGKSTGNAALESSLARTAAKVAEGAALSAALDGFPPTLTQLISTGEKSGRLAEVLGKSADTYEQEFERKVTRMIATLEPTMILVMGLIVAFIVLGVLLPMFQLNELIG